MVPSCIDGKRRMRKRRATLNRLYRFLHARRQAPSSLPMDEKDAIFESFREKFPGVSWQDFASALRELDEATKEAEALAERVQDGVLSRRDADSILGDSFPSLDASSRDQLLSDGLHAMR